MKLVGSLARWLVSPLRTKDCFLCIISAALLILSFPDVNLWIFAWFGFVPLFFALRDKSRLKAFLLAYLAGIIFWSGAIYWLVHVTLPGTIILILYLALYFGIFGLAFFYAYHLRLTTYHLFLIPSFWVLLEYIRSFLFTGFPWALLGYSQCLNLPLIQIADITGAWGVSFLVMLANVTIYSVVSYKSSVVSKTQKLILPVLCILASFIYGYYRISHLPLTTYHLPLKASVIQGNIPQELKWLPAAQDYILKKYVQLTVKAAQDEPDLIIWPEASSPGLLGEDNAVFKIIYYLAARTETPLLIGAVARDGEKYFNSALLIDKTGKITSRYDKLHLVPFGEYIPLKKVLPFLETVVPIGDINRGRDYTVFTLPLSRRLPTVKFSVLICFEDLFPELSRRFVQKGAGLLVNITNDAWYKRTSAAAQHLQASVFRAVENRTPLVRAANTGISGFISPSGRITSLVRDAGGREIFIDGWLTQEIAVAARPDLSFYSRYGDILVMACLLFILYVIIQRTKARLS